MTTSRKSSANSNPEWATVNGRIAWLVKSQFGGSRTAMAKAIGFSHTIIAKVVKESHPGHRLLDAIVARLSVDSNWLNDGVGQPFRHGDDVGQKGGIPVTTVLLPGPPLDHQAMITGGWIVVPEVVSSQSTYWLSLASAQPILRSPASGFRTGDHLLMEADPAKFPRESALNDALCVMRVGPASDDLLLARVDYFPASIDSGKARLEAEFYDGTTPNEMVVEDVYHRFPNGDVKHHQRQIKHVERQSSVFQPPVVRYTDIVSVWLGILRRPLG